MGIEIHKVRPVGPGCYADEATLRGMEADAPAKSKRRRKRTPTVGGSGKAPPAPASGSLAPPATVAVPAAVLTELMLTISRQNRQVGRLVRIVRDLRSRLDLVAESGINRGREVRRLRGRIRDQETRLADQGARIAALSRPPIR